MKYISSYLISSLKCIISLLISILLITLLEYNNLLGEVGTSFLLFLSLFIVLIIGSILFKKKGYLFGIIFISLFFIITIYNNSFQYKLFLYYFIIEVTSYLGYFIKKKRKTN